KGSAPGPAARSGGPWAWAFWLGAILFVTYLVYLPSLDNQFTNWDDNYYVLENPVVAHPTAGSLLTQNLGGNHHPLTMATLAVNYAISGTKPFSYHWLNLLLHVANTALVFFFVRKLSGGRFWAAAVTALFFGIHPMHVESVAWISERKDVLYTAFFLGGAIAYWRYLDRRQWQWLGVTFLMYLLSCLSKGMAVVFPLVMVLLDLWHRRPVLERRAL